MGTHTLLIMKFVNIVLLGAVGCFASPQNQVNQGGKSQLSAGGKVLIRNGLNWMNGIFAQGESTKDLRAGVIASELLKTSYGKKYGRRLSRWFQPCGPKRPKKCQKVKGQRLPTVEEYLNTVQADMRKSCGTGQLCFQIQRAVIKNLRDSAKKNNLMKKPADNAYFQMVN